MGWGDRYATLNASTGALNELFPGGKPGNPCITRLAAGELLLARDNVGIFLGPDAKVSRKLGLTWSDSPCAIAFSAPYAIALLPNYVECRRVLTSLLSAFESHATYAATLRVHMLCCFPNVWDGGRFGQVCRKGGGKAARGPFNPHSNHLVAWLPPTCVVECQYQPASYWAMSILSGWLKLT